jgi:PPM family protein phosphatase
MERQSVAHTSVGMKRQQNEDAHLVDDELGLYVVCDGMGGHAGGDVASQMAVSTAKELMLAAKADLARFDGSGAARDDLLRLVENVVLEAGKRIHAHAQQDPARKGMGTTMTMLVIVGGIGAMAHVGDSRLYLARAGRLHQLSDDHTYVAEAVRRGVSTYAEAKAGPYANVVTRALGVQPTVRVDTLLFDASPGDSFLLCSDGLHRYFESGDELCGLISGDHLGGIARQLVELSNHRGGSDNITAVAVRMEGVQTSATTTDVQHHIDTMRHVAMFAKLEMNELYQLLNISSTEHVRPKHLVLQEGEASQAMYVLVEGELVVERRGRPLATLLRGAHVGEMSLFGDRFATATVRTIGSAKLLRIDRQRFTDLVRKEPTLGVKLLWAMATVLTHRLDEVSAALANDEPATLTEAGFA